jgi:tRNA-dihydrouridine synthase
MAAITHSAFRRLLSDFGGYGALFTEMLSAKMILHENLGGSAWLKRRAQEGKVIYQLMVSDTVNLPEIIDRLAPLRPDGLDLNVACAAPTVTKQGGGADLFRDMARLREIVQVMRKSFDGPLTAKIRLGKEAPGWKDLFWERLHLLKNEGVDALTVHPRFYEEKFKRSARHVLYAEIAAQAGIPVIANGDITGVDYYRDRLDLFAPVAGIMIGRTAAACPWVFGRWHNPDLPVDHAEVWERLCDYIAEDFTPDQALTRIKVYVPYYARNFVFGHELFRKVQSAPDCETARKRAREFFATSPELVKLVGVGGI